MKCPICHLEILWEPVRLVQMTKIGSLWAAQISDPASGMLLAQYAPQPKEDAVEIAERWAFDQCVNLHFHWPDERLAAVASNPPARSIGATPISGATFPAAA